MDVQVWPLFCPYSLWGFAGLLLSDKFVEFFARNAGAQPCPSKRPQTEPCQIWVWSWNNLDLSIDKVRFSGGIMGLTWFDDIMIWLWLCLATCSLGVIAIVKKHWQKAPLRIKILMIWGFGHFFRVRFRQFWSLCFWAFCNYGHMTPKKWAAEVPR